MGAVALITRFLFRESTEAIKPSLSSGALLSPSPCDQLSFIFTFQEALPIPFNTDRYVSFLLNLFHLRSSLNLNSFNFRPLIQLVLLFNHPVKVPIINVPAFSKYSLKFLLKISIVWCVFKFEFKWFVQEVAKDRMNVCAPLGHVYALFYVFNFVEVLLVRFLV